MGKKNRLIFLGNSTSQKLRIILTKQLDHDSYDGQEKSSISLNVYHAIPSWSTSWILANWSNGGLGHQPSAYHDVVVPFIGKPVNELCRVIGKVVPKHARILAVIVHEVGKPAGHAQP